MTQSKSDSSEQGWTRLSMSGDSLRHWWFIGGQWGQDKYGVIRPPHNLTEQNLTLFTRHAYGDFEAEFEFRWDIMWTTGALVFRAQDATHYYVVDFPVVAQQYRAEHFWGTVAKVDERNWREGLHMQMVHGVSSAPHLWHKARVEAKGDEIRVWCDDRPLAVVRDKTYSRPGFVGLTTYSGSGESAKSSFRNLRIRGLTAEPARWDESTRPARNWDVVDPSSGSGCSNIVRAGSGDLLVVSDGRIWRSADNGRSWAADDTDLPEYVRQGWEGPHDYGLMRQTEDGGLEVYSADFQPPFAVRRGRSEDHGMTWSRPQEMKVVEFPEGFSFLNVYTTRLVETQAGTLLIFAYASNEEGYKTIRGRREELHGVPTGMNFCLRSTDGGKTFSGAIDIDGPPYDDTSTTIRRPGSEISVTQTANGGLLALVRPWTSPMMWESWSHDDGKTWTPLARGPFPMYACYNSIITTTSGVVLIAGRFPRHRHAGEPGPWDDLAVLSARPDHVG